MTDASLLRDPDRIVVWRADFRRGLLDEHRSVPTEVVGFVRLWRLEPAGPLIATRSSWVLPVRAPAPAMLKVARTADELSGFGLMRWWDGRGAAKVLLAADGALLLERAEGGRNLADMARSGEDDAATRILCDTVGRLHAPHGGPMPDLHTLTDWFRPLLDRGASDVRLAASASIARQLLSTPEAVVPLHGDVHHDNVLDFGERGFLAIDPHGLIGERLFDYANIFTNPDLADSQRAVATLPGRFEARLAIVTDIAKAEPGRMLRWIVAWTGLSATWFLDDRDETLAAVDLAINGMAWRMLST